MRELPLLTSSCQMCLSCMHIPQSSRPTRVSIMDAGTPAGIGNSKQHTDCTPLSNYRESNWPLLCAEPGLHASINPNYEYVYMNPTFSSTHSRIDFGEGHLPLEAFLTERRLFPCESTDRERGINNWWEEFTRKGCGNKRNDRVGEERDAIVRFRKHQERVDECRSTHTLVEHHFSCSICRNMDHVYLTLYSP